MPSSSAQPKAISVRLAKSVRATNMPNGFVPRMNPTSAKEPGDCRKQCRKPSASLRRPLPKASRPPNGGWPWTSWPKHQTVRTAVSASIGRLKKEEGTSGGAANCVRESRKKDQYMTPRDLATPPLASSINEFPPGQGSFVRSCFLYLQKSPALHFSPIQALQC